MAVQRVQLNVSFQYEDANGKLIPIPTATPLTILDRNTGNPPTIYAGLSGSTTITSPATDAGGNVPGYVVEGSYSITAAANVSATPPFAGATVNFEAVRGDGVENIYPGAVGSAAIAPGAVLLSHLAAAVAQALVPTGTVLDYGGSTAPAGYALCDGSSHSTTDPIYSAVFGVIGYSYGGSGGAFNLPDTRGKFALGKGGSPHGANIGETGGVFSHVHTIGALNLTTPLIDPATGNPPLTTINPHHHAVPGHHHTLSSVGGAAVYYAASWANLQLGFIQDVYQTKTNGPSFAQQRDTRILADPGVNNTHVALTVSNYNTGFKGQIPSVPLVGQTDDAVGLPGQGAGFGFNTTDAGATGIANGGITLNGTLVPGQSTNNTDNTPPYVTHNRIIKL